MLGREQGKEGGLDHAINEALIRMDAAPEVTVPAVIDASTQPGFAGSPIVEVDGSLVGPGDGIVLQSQLDPDGPDLVAMTTQFASLLLAAAPAA